MSDWPIIRYSIEIIVRSQTPIRDKIIPIMIFVRSHFRMKRLKTAEKNRFPNVAKVINDNGYSYFFIN